MLSEEFISKDGVWNLQNESTKERYPYPYP